MALQLPLHYTYPIYTAILAAMLLALVPRPQIKRLVIYGIAFGALSNVAVVLLAFNGLQLGGHINYGPLGVFGIPFFPPVAWSVWFILYFHFLPKRLFWRIIYRLAAISYAVFFSNILVNYNVFQWNYGRVLIPFLIFGTWLTLATWAYMRVEYDSERTE